MDENVMAATPLPLSERPDIILQLDSRDFVPDDPGSRVDVRLAHRVLLKVGQVTTASGETHKVLSFMFDCGIDYETGKHHVQVSMLRISELGTLLADLMQCQVDDVVSTRL